MAKQRRARTDPSPGTDRPAVTADRFARLYRLVQLLGNAPQNREVIARRLSVDIRGFYRDLDLLRKAGVLVSLSDGRYTLSEKVDLALSRLPFPDAHLTLGDARLLAKGRTKTHQQLQAQIKQILPS
jgi:predicted DNA-binding transcriptional regulator YafY